MAPVGGVVRADSAGAQVAEQDVEARRSGARVIEPALTAGESLALDNFTLAERDPAQIASPLVPGPGAAPAVIPQPIAAALAVPPVDPARTLHVTAAPENVPQVLQAALAEGDDSANRIVVQLDPPELGRVSLDFSFDSQGLQNVTVTAETPEAARKLRLMYFELVQALEQRGLSGDNLTFSQERPRQETAALSPPRLV